jgi:poly(3-hydroxyoctanoate) depolymerase
VSLSMGSAVALRLAVEHPERVRRLVLVTACGGVDTGAFGAVDWRPSFRARRPDAPTYLVDDREELSPRLAAVRAPTLLVYGARDLVAPVAVGERLRALLPDATLELVPGATHDLEEEEPDLLAALIEAHLRR